MPFVDFRLLLASLALGLVLLLKWPTTTSSWVLLACWPLGVFCFCYIARVYLAPYVLMRFSSHIRVRSVSLRSIRGLYFRKGSRTWRIDRFVYSYRSSADDGPRRLSFRIEGFTLEIDPPPPPHPPPPRPAHRRGLTLADLSPSPLALYLWSIISGLYALFDPAVRPVIRFVVTAALQQVIRFIPRLTETVQVDIDQAVVSYVGSPQVQLVVQNVSFRGHVSFAQSPQLHPVKAYVPSSNQALSARALAMGAWKSRLSNGLQRAWTRTWNDTLGQMTGSISYGLVVQQIHGFIPSDGLTQMAISNSGTILRSSKSFLVSGSARFSPRDGTVEPCSVQNQVKVGAIHIDADNLHCWLSHFKAATKNIPTVSPSSLSIATSPWLKTPFSAPSLISDGRVQVIAKRRKQRVKPLELVASASIDLDSVTVSRKMGCEKYSVVFKGATCSCEPSNPAVNRAHRAWLGKGSSTMSWTFLFRLRLQGISVHRPSGVAQLNDPILSVGSTSVDATFSDWPSVLPSDPRPCDTDLPFVFLEVHIASLSFADRHDMLLNLASELSSPNNAPRGESEPFLPTVVSPVPRISANVRVGRTFTRVTCADLPGVEEPFSVELETEGMVFSSSSNFRIGVTSTRHLSLDGDLPFCMTCPFTFFLHPLFLRLRTHSPNITTRRMSRWGSECTNDETLFSMEAVEANGVLTGLGEANDDDQFLSATLDTRTIFVDLHCCTEAGVVELWHPRRLRILSVLLSLLSARWPSSHARPPRRSPTSHLGCAFSFSVARFVLFITGSDANPDTDKDITRGIAFSTGFSLRCCSINAEHIYALPRSSPSQTRAKLSLPVDRFCDVAFSENVSGTNVIIGKFMLWNTAFRAATADRFSMDDPHIMERDNPLLHTKQLLSIKGVDVDIKFTPRTPTSSTGTACDVNFTVDDALTRFELGLIYSTLLALRTVQILRRCAVLPRVSDFPPHSTPSTILTVRGTIKAIRIRLQFMDETAIVRVNYLDMALTPQDARCSTNSLLVWVPVNQRESVDEVRTQGGTWEELVRIHRCSLSLAPSLKGPIMVDSDSIRIRIPFGYVFAELQLAAVVTFKAVKHLVRVVQSTKLSPIPAPEAESAKLVPDVTFNCRMFCFEAADDPFESRVGFNFRVGLAAAKARLHREEAFDAKATAVMLGNLAAAETSVVNTDYQFGEGHSVSVEDARQRLRLAHSLDWTTRYRQHIQERVTQEELVRRELYGAIPLKRPTRAPDLVKPAKSLRTPPLLRIIISGFRLHLQRPNFTPERLASFLHEQGSGLPHETCYSLLVPMHLNITLTAIQVALRDYPLPLLYIPSRSGDHRSPSLVFDTDLVIAEEMGPPQSVDWITCPVYGVEDGFVHIHPLVLRIPKTLMPVKTYARPLVSVLADKTTAFVWGVSYSPAIQDVVRVLDSMTPETRDPSPSVGFWDKLRLIFHWTIKISFQAEVRLYVKGNRDPYILDNDGAGFALCWQGEPHVNIGSQNEDGELIQVTSDSMSILIPKFEPVTSSGGIYAQGHTVSRNDWAKMCANLRSGIRFGVGAMFERTCSSLDCGKCTASPFHRACRFFHFRPHHTVQLVKVDPSELQIDDHDSYHGFRSNFIHLSISITSALRQGLPRSVPHPSSFHLTPKAFASFWSWWGLFDNGLPLLIRQGSLYHRKSLSPKFARHIATVKYRISVPELFITHAYIDDSRESWEDGTTTIVGLKAKVSHFQADMHQRDQETIVPGKLPDSVQIVRHKPFYAAEVVLRDVDLRAMLAVFLEPLKQSVFLSANSDGNNNNHASSSSEIPPSWLSSDDFVETDWSPVHSLPEIQLYPVLSCPKVTYLKKNSCVTEIHVENSKFGDEDTHTCLLGSEPSVPQVEISLAEQRITTLQHMAKGDVKSAQSVQRQYPLGKMIALLRDYTKHLKTVDQCPESARRSNVESYYMPAEMVSADEWADFENVYQVHSPNLFMCNAVRDVLMRYYNCSRARRGYEYHMATRAVKFIRDQAEAMVHHIVGHNNTEKFKAAPGAAQTAASALRKMLAGGWGSTSLDIQTDAAPDPTDVKPLDGWEDGVTLRKRHFCFLLKPQIILRSSDPLPSVDKESVVILAAIQAKLQVFKIMDASNLEDPISGHVMHRNYMSLDGLQTFCPTDSCPYDSGSVPLEVLLDYRCESNSFDLIVPQTNANCQYDRFNRLRLRNNVASAKAEHTHRGRVAHLQNDTDLVQVHVPRFTVSANDRHFQFISNIITHLVLFSDVAHKARLEKLETLLFAYDFTDLRSAANVVSDLQSRLRSVLETHNDVSRQLQDNHGHPQKTLQILKFKAHIFLLVEELNLIFDAIRLAQSRTDGHSDHKSALLLQASSSEISWRMLDECRELLAKLAVRNIDFSWLSKQDSSTVNRLTVGDLQAFDGSPNAIWTEIVCKYEELSNHPLCKRDLFLDADWTVLAPVGGITIYEKFQLDFHPIRLQLDARLGQRIMEYVWPARRGRNQTEVQYTIRDLAESSLPPEQMHSRSSLESALLMQKPRTSLESNRLAASLRKLGPSRSWTDLRSAAAESTKVPVETYFGRSATPDLNVNEDSRSTGKIHREARPGKDDAVEMKTRSSQKTFVLVKISSIELLLSIIKAESFECRDARIRTHPLEFRNQTWSFDELVDQFIPSDLTWRGWVRMAFHQPLVPVLPVARELFSKTKLIATRSDSRPSSKKFALRGKKNVANAATPDRAPRRSSSSGSSLAHSIGLTGTTFADGPEATALDVPEHGDLSRRRQQSQPRLLSLFGRGKNEACSASQAPPSQGEHCWSSDSKNSRDSTADDELDDDH